MMKDNYKKGSSFSSLKSNKMKRSYLDLVGNDEGFTKSTSNQVDNGILQKELNALAQYELKSHSMTIVEVIGFSNLNLEEIPVASSVILTNIARSCGKYTLDGMFTSCYTVLEIFMWKREIRPVTSTKAHINENSLISSLFEAFEVILNTPDPEIKFVANHNTHDAEGYEEESGRRDRQMMNDDKPEVLQKKFKHLFGKVVTEKLVRQVLAVFKKLVEFEYRLCPCVPRCVHTSEILACLSPATRKKKNVEDVTPEELVHVLHFMHTYTGVTGGCYELDQFQENIVAPFLYKYPPLSKWLE